MSTHSYSSTPAAATSDGTVQSYLRIANGQGGLAAATISVGDWFGRSVASVGDLDNDGVPDMAVGALLEDEDRRGVASRAGRRANTPRAQRGHAIPQAFGAVYSDT